MSVRIDPAPTEDEAVAILAVLATMRAAVASPPAVARWRVAGRVTSSRLPARTLGAHPWKQAARRYD